MTISGAMPEQRKTIPIVFLALAVSILTLTKPVWKVEGQGVAVATVSAASYEAGPVAPESIVAVFGIALAEKIEVASALPLPTVLAGATVKITDSKGVERLAPLFFVSPAQINCLVPEGTAIGMATVMVASGNGAVSNGVLQISQTAPGLFTADSSGQGAVAATVLHHAASGETSYAPVARYDGVKNRYVTVPIDLGPEGDEVYLILFGTGFRGRSGLSDVTAKIGGVDAEVSFAGAQGYFTGLDQINLRIPRSLLGRGRVNLAIKLANAGTTNICELEVGAVQGIEPPKVTGFSTSAVLAGQTLALNGLGFSSNPNENQVRLGGVEARVVLASPTQLDVRVPFGAETGPLSVRTFRGEWVSPEPLPMRTSVSGFISDANQQALRGVVVRLSNLNISAVTNTEGSFILPDVPPGNAHEIQIDSSGLPLPYPKYQTKIRVLANRDNPLLNSIALQQATGVNLQFGETPTLNPGSTKTKRASRSAQIATRRIQTRGVVFEVPGESVVRFPDGGTSGQLTLSIVENSRTPVRLPTGQFSSLIAQIAPFGAALAPGGRLSFPNLDHDPPGTTLSLFRLDQTTASPTLGGFVDAGVAIVSADAQRIETAANAITEATIYFVSKAGTTTIVTGRVVDSDGQTPVRQALVRSRGQETFTDGNGGFILRGVLVNQGDQLSVDVSFVRSNGRVDRTQRSGVAAVVDGVTSLNPDLALPSEESNRPPIILAPASLSISEGETRDILLLAADPDQGQSIQLGVSGANFASIIPRSNDLYALRLVTTANDAGRYTLTLTAVDNQGAIKTIEIFLRVNRPPIAQAQTVITDENKPAEITLTASDPDGDSLNFVIVGKPSHGVISEAPPKFIYTPQLNYNGSDSFTFKVNDELSESNTATVSVLVRPVNNAPELTTPGAQAASEGENLIFTVTASDADTDQTLIFSATGLPGGATFTQTSATSARFSWTPLSSQTGNHVVSFTVRDNGAPVQSDTRSASIRVVGKWSSTAKIEGGAISSLINAGPSLFAGTAGGGVFRSNDLGQSWTPVNQGLSVLDIRSLAAVGPAIFAGTSVRGVFRSMDNGQSWTPANAGMENRGILALGVQGTTLFAGSVSTAGGAVFRSTDNGQSWTRETAGLPVEAGVRSFAFSGASIFAGTDGAGVFSSTDNGRNWIAINAGLPQRVSIQALAVSGNRLFAGTNGDGLFVFSDAGNAWSPVSGLVTAGETARMIRAIVVLSSGIFVAADVGVFRSTDSGQSWTFSGSGVFCGPLSFAAVGATLFTGTYCGVFVTTTDGQNWAQTSAGIAATSVESLVQLGSELFANVIGGTLQRSSDHGQSWVNISGALPSPHIYSIALNGGALLAGGYGEIYLSNNGGGSWQKRTGLPKDNIFTLAVLNGSIFAGTGRNGLYRSTDDGLSWSPIQSGLGAVFVNTIVARGGTLFAGANGAGVFRSTDNGDSWAPINAGLPGLNIGALIATDNGLLAGTLGGGVFRTTDEGNTWTGVNLGLTPFAEVNAFSSDGGSLFAATNFNGVFLSLNGGTSWTPIGGGLPPTRILSLSAGGSRLFAGTANNGVWTARF